MSNKIKQVILIILDGWGYAPSWGGNAISQAMTPNINKLWRENSHGIINASGKWVGLPGHERGNSEVGHLNIGAGKVIYQDISFINNELETKDLSQNDTIQKLIKHVIKNNSSINLMGLVSNGGVHSHSDHLCKLINYFSGFPELKNKIFTHVFTDGRDSPPQEAIKIISKMHEKIETNNCCRIATVCGRYFAMDRDNHWDRTQMAYDMMVKGIGKTAKNPLSAISQAYSLGETDEFISPTVICDENDQPIHTISKDDGLLFFNFRSDRARQLSLAFTSQEFDKFPRKIIPNLFFVNMIPYGIEKEYDTSHIYSLFRPQLNKTCLAKIISDKHLSQLHIAETEKYAHVTYFFNGGIETPFLYEDRVLINSPRVSTYDKEPVMSAEKITEELIKKLDTKKYAFVVVNYANADMVGHTGNYQATIKACEFVDQQIGKLLNSIDRDETAIIITADHGNAEEVSNPRTGEIETEHTSNLVPCIIIVPKGINISNIKPNMRLANIAPTILYLLGIDKPQYMDEKLF